MEPTSAMAQQPFYVPGCEKPFHIHECARSSCLSGNGRLHDAHEQAGACVHAWHARACACVFDMLPCPLCPLWAQTLSLAANSMQIIPVTLPHAMYSGWYQDVILRGSCRSHQDQVTALPPSAQLLASSSLTPNEIWAIGDQVLGIQGKPPVCASSASLQCSALAARDKVCLPCLSFHAVPLPVHEVCQAIQARQGQYAMMRKLQWQYVHALHCRCTADPCVSCRTKALLWDAGHPEFSAEFMQALLGWRQQSGTATDRDIEVSHSLRLNMPCILLQVQSCLLAVAALAESLCTQANRLAVQLLAGMLSTLQISDARK